MSNDLLKQLEEYELKDVESTGIRIGRGSYGYVEKVKVNGTICAAKKIHKDLQHEDNEGVDNFKQKCNSECLIMSRLRHPHVVQFLGVHLPTKEEEEEDSTGSSLPSDSQTQYLQLPWLIMEFLPVNLDSFLKKSRNIPYSIKFSLLCDISKGISYLHSQKPLPIIHRDLTAKNILINSSLVAKIADFGVARIVNPLSNTMSVGPGAILYMPPEVHEISQGSDKAHYFTSIDIFSFGVNILYTIIQECPLALRPSVYPDPTNPGKLVPVSEVERRDRYFTTAYSLIPDKSSPEFKLIDLAKTCLNNDASLRPPIGDLLKELETLHSEAPDDLMDRDKFELMEIARGDKDVVLCNGTAMEEVVMVQQENLSLSSKVQSLEVENQHLHSRIEQLNNDLCHYENDKRRLESLVEENRRLDSSLRMWMSDHESLQRELEESLLQKKLQIERLNLQLTREVEISEDRKQAIDLLERKLADQVGVAEPTDVVGNVNYDVELKRLNQEIEHHKQQIRQRDSENNALKTEAQLLRTQLLDKEEVSRNTIKKLEMELSKMSSSMATPTGNLPPSLPDSGISVDLPLYWKKCHSSPFSMHCGQCVLFGSNLLYGSGSGTGDNKRRILKFDIHTGRWDIFSVYLYEHFSMSVVMGKLLIVGGYDSIKDRYSDRVSEWSERGYNWVCISGSPLPTPRADAVTVGFKKWLIVAGGFNGVPLDKVDLLDCDGFGQWYSLTSLPKPAYAMQSAFFYDTAQGNEMALWYLMSTSRGCGLNRRRPVYFVRLHNLIERRGSWTVLPDPPLINSGAVTVKGHLLAVGGSDKHSAKKDIHMYFPGTNEWLKVAVLQYSCHSCSCAPLSDKNTKFIVVGGQGEGEEYLCKMVQYNITL